MKILFIGAYANEETKSILDELSSNEGKLSVAAIKYTWLISEGLHYNIGKNCTNLFLVPIGMFPRCKLIFWKGKKIGEDYYIPFINLILIKQLTILIYIFFFSFIWYIKTDKNIKKVIVFSSLYIPFLMAVAPLKLLKNIHIASFVPDLPDYQFLYSKQKFSLKKILIPLYLYLSKKIILVNDFFVYITKYMKDYFGCKPYCIIEGFSDSNLQIKMSDLPLEKKAIMYAGALFEKFGIRILIDAFHEIEGDYELWLFGNGDMEKEIELFSLKDKRIKYFGTRSNSEILEFEKKAKLLVNPRFTNNEFTKYSFPSKLMEYMASGTPVLTTKLAGIEEEYFDKMYYIEVETTDGLKRSLLFCLSKTQKELDSFGDKARLYVINEKNNNKQIGKFIKALEDQFFNIN